MAQDNQADLFLNEVPLDEDSPTPEYRADPNSVRAERHKILAEVRAAQKLPWEPSKALLYRTIFPQMTKWQPDEEGAQLKFEFETEIKRLEAVWEKLDCALVCNSTARRILGRVLIEPTER